MSSGYTPPPWQAPPRRTGWGDPRLSQQQQQPPPPQQYQYGQQYQPSSTQSPISPINPQAFAYHGPEASQPPPFNVPASQYDTSTWGVKYNQNYSQTQDQQWPAVDEAPPALPPRPTSTVHENSQQASVNQWQQSYPTTTSPPPPSGHHQQPSWTGSTYDQHQSYPTMVPPPPPPKPPIYEAQTQQPYSQQSRPYDQYSQHAPTHNYEPRPTSQHHLPQHQHYGSTQLSDAGPVSPIDPEPNRWPTPHPPAPQQYHSVMQAPAIPGENQFYSTALGPFGGPSDWEHFGDTGSSPEVTSPPGSKPRPSTAGTTAAATTMTEQTDRPAPPATKPQPPTTALRHDSEASSVGSGGLQRSETIDGVINAWTAPLKVAPKVGQTIDERPQSRDSVQEQPKERIVEVVKEVVKEIDPYADLELEFKASLKRYAEMLRKEAAAETDELKFAAFEAFIKKELRMRAMLYGMDSPLQLIKTHDRAHDKPITPAKAAQVLSSQPDLAPPPVPLPSPAPPLETNHSDPMAGVKSDSSDQASRTSMEPPLAVPEPRAGISLECNVEPQSSMAGASNSTDNRDNNIAPDDIPPAFTGPSIRHFASQLKDSPMEASTQKEEPYVMVNADESEEYSPGGRPLPNKTVDEAYSPGGRPLPLKGWQIAGDHKRVPDISIPKLPPPKATITSPGADAPMVLEDYVMPGLPSPGANAPIVVDISDFGPPLSHNIPGAAEPQSGSEQLFNKTSTGPNLKFEPARPAYTPFRYNPVVEAPLMPADKSYSTLRKDGADSGRLLKHGATPERPSTSGSGHKAPATLQPVNKMQDEAFIGLIRQQSKAVRKSKPNLDAAPPIPSLRPGTPARAASPATASMTPPAIAALRPGTPSITPAAAVPTALGLEGALATLRSTLPKSVPDGYGLSSNDAVNELKDKIDSIPDQFGFIHDTVVGWDQRNRKVRKRLDEERHARSADSEARIDDLFNDNEIGYADISSLEAEFKLAEARLKYDEDKDELDSFTTDVYQSVTDQLSSELADLNIHYTTAVDLLDLHSEPASRCLQHPQAPEMGTIMTLLLSLFNKIEIRQTKIAEAKVERERRRKRLELTVLYTNGDTPGVKALEAEFAVAEKMQVLHEARARDTRANKLMDTFDRATVRGLGDNQTYVDDLLPRIRAVRDAVLNHSENDPPHPEDLLYGSSGVRETLTTAQHVAEYILADSQKLLTISNVADKQLNEADFSVSVAEAKVSNADKGTYVKLGEEKGKEDRKIVEDTNSRMGAVGKGPGEVLDLVREVLGRVGADGGHEERVKRALELAKVRNREGGEVGDV